MKSGDTVEYRLIRSKRRTLGLEVRPEGVIVRAPLRVSKAEINEFVLKNKAWIEKQQVKMEELKKREEGVAPLTMDEIRLLAEQASKVIPERVRHYAPLIGVTYGRITIRNQRTKWGSCSAQGNLNFNCLLMLTPSEVQDAVVVNELCHRKYLDHSPEFYREVERVYPDYRKWDSWLKQEGNLLMRRMKRM